MKQSNVIKGTLAVVALVAALVVGVAVHMHSVGSPTAGHSTQNTAKTATETTAKTAESITADYPCYSSAEEGVKAAGLVVTGVPLDSRERILYPEIDFTSAIRADGGRHRHGRAGRAGDRHPGACHQSHQGRRESRRHH